MQTDANILRMITDWLYKTHWLRNHQDGSAIFTSWRFRSLWIAEPSTLDGSVAAKYQNRLDGSAISWLRNCQ